MKKILILLLWSISFHSFGQDDFNGCPPEGDAAGANDQATNRLKNRYEFPPENAIDQSITLDAMLAPGNDEGRFSESKAARISGYVVHVNKKGSVETCNCHADEPLFTDTHIEVVLDQEHAGKRERVIVEVTPRIRALMADKGIDWSSEALQNLEGKHVTFTGWMLWDSRHKKDAENTDPGDAAQNWRATCWELHPVTGIEIEDDPNAAALKENSSGTTTPVYFTSSFGSPDDGSGYEINRSKFQVQKTKSTGEVLKIILISALLGMCGQVIRVIAGLKKVQDKSNDIKNNFKSVLDENKSTVLYSLLIALIVGSVAGILFAVSSGDFIPDSKTFIALITAGYAGTDLIEGFAVKR